MFLFLGFLKVLETRTKWIISCVNYPTGIHKEHIQFANFCRTGWVFSACKKGLSFGFQINSSVIRQYLCLMWIESKSSCITSVSADETTLSKRDLSFFFLFISVLFQAINFAFQLKYLCAEGVFLLFQLGTVNNFWNNQKLHLYPNTLERPSSNPAQKPPPWIVPVSSGAGAFIFQNAVSEEVT